MNYLDSLYNTDDGYLDKQGRKSQRVLFYVDSLFGQDMIPLFLISILKDM